MHYQPVFHDMDKATVLLDPTRKVDRIPAATKLEQIANRIGCDHGQAAEIKFGNRMFHDAVDLGGLGVSDADVEEIVGMSARNCFLGRAETDCLSAEQKERLYQESVTAAKNVAAERPQYARAAWNDSFNTVYDLLVTSIETKPE